MDKEITNVRPRYTQQVLSGFSHLLQSQDENGETSQDEQGGKGAPQELEREQKAYQIFVPIVIEGISSEGDKLLYRVHIDANPHLLVSPYSLRSKKPTKTPVTISFTQGKKKAQVLLDYGVQQKGERSLSHSDGTNPLLQIATLTSLLLGAIDATIQRTIQLPEAQESVQNPGSSAESSQSSENLGTHKAKRRSKKVHPEVHVKDVPENSTGMAEVDRPILGNGHTDRPNGLLGVEDVSGIGGDDQEDTLGF